MRIVTSRILTLSAAVLATAAPATIAAPTAQVSSASDSAGSVSVSGVAGFPAITAPQSVVGGDATKTAGAAAGTPAGEAAGLALTDATIVPLPDGLRFTWKVASLPAQVPPEGVRYNWAFKIGERLYQLQAKRTNVASTSTAEAPVGHLQRAAAQQDFFQLRGACAAEYLGAPINGCYHLAFLSGQFDIENKSISIDMPYETRDEIGRIVAPDFKPGAVLVDNGGEGTATMVIAASFQAAVSNTQTSQYITGIDPYYVGPRIDVGLGAANSKPRSVNYSVPATLDPDGRFSATLTRAPNATTVFVRACDGTACTYAQRAIG